MTGHARLWLSPLLDDANVVTTAEGKAYQFDVTVPLMCNGVVVTVRYVALSC